MLGEGPPVTLESITVQSFTFTEFFYRCSSSFPLVVFPEGDERAANFRQSKVWGGRAFNLDEAYEFWDGLGLLASGRGGGDKDRAPTVHASTLNTLIGGGKTRRATRTSTSFGESWGKRVSVSLLGNGHRAKFMAMDRGTVGNHTACTKERFVICIDHATRRHAALPAGSRLPSGVSEWTWLPLTPQQARTFGWVALLDVPAAAQAQGLETDDAADEASAAPSQAGAFVGPPAATRWNSQMAKNPGSDTCVRVRPAMAPRRSEMSFGFLTEGDLPDPTEHNQNGAKRVAQLFATKPQATLPFEDEARKVMMGNQVAQRIRVEQRADDDTTLAALEANAAGPAGRPRRTLGHPGLRGRRRLLGPAVWVADHHHQACPVCETLIGHQHRHTGHLASSSRRRRRRRGERGRGRRRTHAPSPACSRASPSRRFRRASRHAGSNLRGGAQSPRARRWMQAARDLAPPSSSLSLRPPKQAKRRMPSPWTTTHRSQKCSRCSSKMCQARGISTRRASAKQGL